jgi:multiple sugar transport system permease protein
MTTSAATRRAVPRATWWIVNVSLAALFLYPFWVVVSQSIKTPIEAAAAPPTLFPGSFSLANFIKLFSNENGGAGFMMQLGNSVLVSVGATALTIVLSTLAGYGFAKLRFRGSNLLFFATLATFMIPFQAVITPLYLVLHQIGLTNSLLGLMLVYTTFHLPFGIFLMRNSFAALPPSIEEAALVDGCSVFRAMVRVLLPMAVPGVISTALFTFFASWNEFFAALILITDQSKYTLPVALSVLSSGTFGTLDWGALQAGVAVTIIPCIVIYVLLQKYYVGGMLTGATK